MKISEKQLQILIQVLADSVRVQINGDNKIFFFAPEFRENTYKEIMGQQSNKLKEVDDEPIFDDYINSIRGHETLAFCEHGVPVKFNSCEKCNES